MMSARVCPLSRCASTRVAQRLDRGDHEQAARLAQRGQVRAVAEQVLDLGREVEGDVGPLGVELARHRERVGGPVQEVGVAEGDVARAGLDLLAHVGQHHLARHAKKRPP